MALLGDREWESQMAVDTYEKRSSLEGDVNGAAGGSRVGESVNRGHKYEKQHIYTEIEKESVSNSAIQ